MVPQKDIYSKTDFISIMGYNTDGNLQQKLWKKIFSAAEKAQFYINKILAQLIHDRVVWEVAHSREESDWLAAERLLFQEYGRDGFLNITVGSFLLEATRIFCLWYPEKLPGTSRFIVVKGESFLVSSKKFLDYLNEVALSEGGIWLIFQIASEKAEIDFQGVERLVWLELEELFQKKLKDGYQWFGG